MRLLFASITVLILLLNYHNCDSMQAGNTGIYFEFPSRIMDKPGSQPFLISEVIQSLFPELTNPRRMSVTDLSDQEDLEEFQEGGYTFVLRGDFDKNGKADIAFVGKSQTNNNAFFAILEIDTNKVVRRFFQDDFCPNKAVLMIDPSLIPRTDVIVVHCSMSGDYCANVYWDGQQYVIRNCD